VLLRPELPPGLSGTITVEARLLYRPAPPAVLAEVMQDAAFTPKIVEMSMARATVSIRQGGALHQRPQRRGSDLRRPDRETAGRSEEKIARPLEEKGVHWRCNCP
jgi:hypothetical protein